MKRMFWLALISLGLLSLMACEPMDGPVKDLVFERIDGVDTIVVGELWHDASVYATHQGVPLEVTVDSSHLDVETPGEYVVVYQVQVNRKTVTLERVVFVVEPSLPTLTLLPGIDTVWLGENWVDAGVSVTGPNQDNHTLLTEGTVLTAVPGLYTITYRLTGEHGIVAEVIRHVTVLDVEADVIAS